jgi:hypothetical protein
MSTARKTETARTNGRKSRVPKTSRGKHRLAAKVLAPEAEAEVAGAFQGLVETWKPATDLQFAALRTLAAARCYRQRVWQAITEAWDRTLHAQDPAIKLLPESDRLNHAHEALIADPVSEVLARHDTRSYRRLHRAVEEVVSLFSAEKHTPVTHETHKRAHARHSR